MRKTAAAAQITPPRRVFCKKMQFAKYLYILVDKGKNMVYDSLCLKNIIS